LIKDHTFNVKVPGLINLPAGKGYVLGGNTSEAGKNHLGNHYFTQDAIDNLKKFITTIAKFGWSPLAINDASLVWRGRFDIFANWTSSHDEHRTGEEVDVSVEKFTDPKQVKNVYDEFCKKNQTEIPTTILWHDKPWNITPKPKYYPHFHLRLNGLYTGGGNVGKSAACSQDSFKKI
jgi:hypothetical protein